jgi:ribulose-phosphate 3-epimerase
MSQIKIYPSLLAADFGHLEQGVKMAESSGADGLHLDIMDGHFVPNLSMGPDVLKMARRATDMHLNVHLMCSRPQELVDLFISAGADTILIHIEADCDQEALLDYIKKCGIRNGITLNPPTETERIIPYLNQVDEVLCMTVNPGFGGQSFIPEVLEKIRTIRQHAPDVDIMVDGGINDQTGPQAVAAGANILVAGTYLYRAPDMQAELAHLRSESEAAL